MGATLNGEIVPRWEPITVPAGSTLRLGAAKSGGMRAYLAIAGGIDVPRFLGSRATFHARRLWRPRWSRAARGRCRTPA